MEESGDNREEAHAILKRLLPSATAELSNLFPPGLKRREGGIWTAAIGLLRGAF